MSHDPLRGAFERMAPQQVSPAEARDRLGALSPGFRTARRNHRIRTSVAGVTAAIALTVGGPVAIAAIAPGSSNPAVDFASRGEGIDESVDDEVPDDASVDESIDTNTSSSSEDAPDGATETVGSSDKSDDPSEDAEATERDSETLGQDVDSGDDLIDPDAGEDDDSSGETDSSDSDDDEDEGDDSDSDDDEDEGYVEGDTYSETLEGVGTLRVQVIDGELHLVSTSVEGDFDVEVEISESGDEIQAEFSSETSDDHRIEAELEDGELRWEID